MFVKNNSKYVLRYNAHGVTIKLNPGINLIENPLFTKQELKNFFRGDISFVEEPKKVEELTVKKKN